MLLEYFYKYGTADTLNQGFLIFPHAAIGQ